MEGEFVIVLRLPEYPKLRLYWDGHAGHFDTKRHGHNVPKSRLYNEFNAANMRAVQIIAPRQFDLKEEAP